MKQMKEKILKYGGPLLIALSLFFTLLTFQGEKDVSDVQRDLIQKIQLIQKKKIQVDENDAPALLYRIPLISAIGDILCLGCVSRHIDQVNDAYARDWAKWEEDKYKKAVEEAVKEAREERNKIRERNTWNLWALAFWLITAVFECWRFMTTRRKRN